MDQASATYVVLDQWTVPPCPGPEPFASTPCCEPHEIAETRAIVLRHADQWRKIASLSGTHPDDMQRFMDGECSLTWHARVRIREWAGEQR